MTQRFVVSITQPAHEDILRLYEFLVEKDFQIAEDAVEVIIDGLRLLEKYPFSCRKAAEGALGPRLREHVIPFGSSGYVALFEIDGPASVTVLAVRHQREEDYH